MTSHELKNLTRTLGDLLADFERLVNEFAQLSRQASLEVEKLYTLGYEICDLSQWIHLELSTQRQRQAKLSAAACERMKEFVAAGRHLQPRLPPTVSESVAGKLDKYIANVNRRAELVEKMDADWESSAPHTPSPPTG